MRVVLTKRAQKRIESARQYLEHEFYPEYGRNFEDKVLDTLRLLVDQPDLGHEAFSELHRPELLKLPLKTSALFCVPYGTPPRLPCQCNFPGFHVTTNLGNAIKGLSLSRQGE